MRKPWPLLLIPVARCYKRGIHCFGVRGIYLLNKQTECVSNTLNQMIAVEITLSIYMCCHLKYCAAHSKAVPLWCINVLDAVVRWFPAALTNYRWKMFCFSFQPMKTSGNALYLHKLIWQRLDQVLTLSIFQTFLYSLEIAYDLISCIWLYCLQNLKWLISLFEDYKSH